MLHALTTLASLTRETLFSTASAVVGAPLRPTPGPTPRDVVYVEGASQLYRFRRASSAVRQGPPILLLPSLINRWYVLDLHAGASMVSALLDGGLDVWVLDWGVAHDEDRYLDWDDLLARVRRSLRIVRRTTNAPRVGLLGYSIAGTLAGVYTALFPDQIAALVNVTGPYDFSKAGLLQTLTDPRWFDVDAIAAAGNIAPMQLLAGFLALRPTQLGLDATKLASADARRREGLMAILSWAYDNVPFPAAAYATYIASLYQRNELVSGSHRAMGRDVALQNIRCPVLTVAADKDVICPIECSAALNDHVGSVDQQVLHAPGGHLSAVVGPDAPSTLYPSLVGWLRTRLDAQ